jgi:modulator of FtsH protease
MNDSPRAIPLPRNQRLPGAHSSRQQHNPAVTRDLRNPYALLSLSLLWGAGVAATSVALQLPASSPVITLAGFFGLWFAIHKAQNSVWALPLVFGLTGFMVYTLGPLLTHTLALPGGTQSTVTALVATGATCVSLSVYVLATKRDFSFMGGFLFAGIVVAITLALGAMLSRTAGLALVISGLVGWLSVGINLFETRRMLGGGETSHTLGTGWLVWVGVQPVHQPAEPARHRRR